MKRDKRVVSHKNISRKPPIYITLIFILFVKAFNLYNDIISIFFVGLMSAGILILWSLYLIDILKYNEHPTDVFIEKEKEQQLKK